MKRVRFALLSVLSCYLLLPTTQAQDLGSAPPFKAGDTVCFLGDSITKIGTYTSYIQLYYATRFPTQTIHFYNCGVAGDRAEYIMTAPDFRLTQDVLSHQPTAITVMLGMNDVDRPAYGTDKIPPDLSKQEAALKTYEENMPKLLKVLQDGGARLILLTPSIYDDTVKFPPENHNPLSLGANRALGQCAEFVKAWSEDSKFGLVDFYSLMYSVNQQAQAKDGSYTLIGNDRIHPGPRGCLVMAYAFLKAQHLPSDVSRLLVDAASSKVVTQENCTVDTVISSNGGLAFNSLEKAIPMIPPPSAFPAFDLVPFVQDFNQEILTIKGLSAGNYTLKIDDQVVGSFSDAQFGAGINLGIHPETPQYQQAAQAALLNEKVRALSENLREIVTFKYNLAKQGLNPLDPKVYQAKLQAYYDHEKAKAEADPVRQGRLDREVIVRYEDLTKPGQLQKDYDDAQTTFIASCQPTSHHYTITRD